MNRTETEKIDVDEILHQIEVLKRLKAEKERKLKKIQKTAMRRNSPKAQNSLLTENEEKINKNRSHKQSNNSILKNSIDNSIDSIPENSFTCDTSFKSLSEMENVSNISKSKSKNDEDNVCSENSVAKQKHQNIRKILRSKKVQNSTDRKNSKITNDLETDLISCGTQNFKAGNSPSSEHLLENHCSLKIGKEIRKNRKRPKESENQEENFDYENKKRLKSLTDNTEKKTCELNADICYPNLATNKENPGIVKDLIDSICHQVAIDGSSFSSGIGTSSNFQTVNQLRNVFPSTSHYDITNRFSLKGNSPKIVESGLMAAMQYLRDAVYNCVFCDFDFDNPMLDILKMRRKTRQVKSSSISYHNSETHVSEQLPLDFESSSFSKESVRAECCETTYNSSISNKNNQSITLSLSQIKPDFTSVQVEAFDNPDNQSQINCSLHLTEIEDDIKKFIQRNAHSEAHETSYSVSNNCKDKKNKQITEETKILDCVVPMSDNVNVVHDLEEEPKIGNKTFCLDNDLLIHSRELKNDKTSPESKFDKKKCMETNPNLKADILLQCSQSSSDSMSVPQSPQEDEVLVIPETEAFCIKSPGEKTLCVEKNSSGVDHDQLKNLHAKKEKVKINETRNILSKIKPTSFTPSSYVGKRLSKRQLWTEKSLENEPQPMKIQERENVAGNAIPSKNCFKTVSSPLKFKIHQSEDANHVVDEVNETRSLNNFKFERLTNIVSKCAEQKPEISKCESQATKIIPVSNIGLENNPTVPSQSVSDAGDIPNNATVTEEILNQVTSGHKMSKSNKFKKMDKNTNSENYVITDCLTEHMTQIGESQIEDYGITDSENQDDEVVSSYDTSCRNIESHLNFVCCLNGKISSPVKRLHLILFNDKNYIFVQFSNQIQMWGHIRDQEWKRIYVYDVESMYRLTKTCVLNDARCLVLVMMLENEKEKCLQFLLFERNLKVMKVMEHTFCPQNRAQNDPILLCGLDGLTFATAHGIEDWDVFVHTFVHLEENPSLTTAQLDRSITRLQSLCKIYNLPKALLGVGEENLYIWHIVGARLVTSVDFNPPPVNSIGSSFWATAEKGIVFLLTTVKNGTSNALCQLLAVNGATGICYCPKTFSIWPFDKDSTENDNKNFQPAYSEPFLAASYKGSGYLWCIANNKTLACLTVPSGVTAMELGETSERETLLVSGFDSGCVHLFKISPSELEDDEPCDII